MSKRYKNNAIEVAMLNYISTVDKIFGLSDPSASVSTMVNDCIICDTEARALAEGRTNFGCSISGQPLCGEHHYEIMMERSS